MKFRSSIIYLPAILLCSAILYSCRNQNGKIPFDERRARESVIPLTQAQRLQRSFIDTRTRLDRIIRDSSLIQDKNFLTNQFNLSNAESFTRDAIILLLNQDGADGIRIYLGKDEKGMVRLVLLPIDKQGNDIKNKLIALQKSLKIPGISTAQAQPTSDDEAIENGQICPPCIIE